MRLLLKIACSIGIVLAGIIAIYLIFMTVTDYKPQSVESLAIENNSSGAVKIGEKLSALTFNIGYCGLDKNQDFFMDGGTLSRSSSKEQTLINLEKNTEVLKEEDTSFIMLQEVDVKATRSFKINQYDYIKNQMQDYGSAFAINYKVPWVPVPLNKPHGNVTSGINLLSKYEITSAERLALPGKEKWPRQLALLDRCMISSRVPVDNGKELVVIDLHLSAYDKGGVIRKQQLGFLSEYITKEYEKGNYVIAGGDFNHFLPGADPSAFKSERAWPDWLQKIPEDFKPEGFNFYIDKTVPTDRTVEAAYVPGKNYVSIIDGFLISDNIEVTEVKGIDLGFENSDHQPVRVEFVLK